MNSNSYSPTGRLIICQLKLERFLEQIKKINEDEETSESDKVLQIKIIKAEIDKIGLEIDSIKKEINLSKISNIN